MENKVYDFLVKLTDNTNKRQFDWEKTGEDQYRLLLRNGSVLIKKEKPTLFSDPLNPAPLFLLKLFDEKGCFYSNEVTSNLSEDYRFVNSLFLAIKAEEQRVIYEKIEKLSEAIG